MALRKSKVTDYTPDDHNANDGTERGVYMVSKSLEEYGAGRSILVDRKGKIIAGNKTFEAAAEKGFRFVEVETDGNEVVVVKRRDLDLDGDARARLLAYADNRASEVGLSWNAAVVAEDYEQYGEGLLDLFSANELEKLLDGMEADLAADSSGEDDDDDDETPAPSDGAGSLSRRFIVPPFSVLDARQGYWRDRRKAWDAIGIQGELGRDANLTFGEGAQSQPYFRLKNQLREEFGREATAEEIEARAEKLGIPLCLRVSTFDPVLCELVYRWFLPTGGTVLDPFAGGSVRGIVAALLGHRYTGVDLRVDQVEANRVQWEALRGKLTLQRGENRGESVPEALAPEWICADSAVHIPTLPEESFDLVFSCPPYADLERYSDNPADLSTMNWNDFERVYGEIIVRAATRLKPDRFAVFVVGNVRDDRGYFRDLVGLTIEAARKGRLNLYNDGVLLVPLSSAPMRASKQFSGNRKLVKVHQNVLVFFKGDPTRIKSFGEVEAGEIELTETEA